MKITQKSSIGLKGQVKIEVIDHTGQVIEERPWQSNLILDQGLDNMADHFVAQLFEWAAAGTGVLRPTKEVVATTNLYNTTGTQINRIGGARDFVDADIGKLVKAKTGTAGTELGEECIITAMQTPGVPGPGAYIKGVGELTTNVSDWTSVQIDLYSVNQVGLETEVAPRTNIYSAVPGHNSSIIATSTGKVTMQRTFVFLGLTEAKEVLGTSYTATSATHVRRDGTGRQFTATDKGKYIYFTTPFNTGGAISAVIDGDNVTVSAIPGWSAGMSGAIELYAGIPYGEVGFSHDGTVGNNLNIRVRIENGSGASVPIYVLGPTPNAPSQQLRVTYKLDITAAPITAQPGNAAITGGGVMGSSQDGNFVIERLALSSVNADGTSNISFASLEPADAASAGLSPISTGLSGIGGAGALVDRGAGSSSVQMTALAYSPGDFQRYYEGTFGINDGVGPFWVLGIFDAGSSTFPFAFKYGAKQTKSAEISLRVRFRKTWNRDL